MRSRIFILIGAALVGALLLPAPAFGYNEGGSADPSKTSCVSCHGGDYVKGPHSGYSVGTNRCGTCHSAHAAPAGGVLLLPAATVSGTCFTCHDGTGGHGVYGTIAARGLAVGARHRLDVTKQVPAGDPITGGTATRTFSGPNGTLSCDDCHSPHDAATVAPFLGDRLRTADSTSSGISDRLLRQRPTGAPSASARYGSDWCSGCHQGASNGSAGSHNHPVETSATQGYFSYGSVPSLASTSSLGTVLAPLGRSNLGYLMPDPRTIQQQGHAPICEQCHEDSRNLGAVGSATRFTVTAPDGTNAGDNPRFQDFPHQTVNQSMLVETGDDLCTNCHAPGTLP